MNVAILLGILGPLTAVSSSWVLMARTFRRDPRRLTSFMAAAFAAKMVFFAGYVALAMAVLAVAMVPFIASFTASFIVLYAAEAMLLQRMIAAGHR